jgi:hypothetical protein
MLVRIFMHIGLMVVMLASDGLVLAQAGASELTDARLESGEHFDLDTRTVTEAGARLHFELTSSDFDVSLVVLDPAGSVLAEFDNSEGVGTDVRETIVALTPGTYTLGVTPAISGALGAYVRVRELPGMRKEDDAAPNAPMVALPPVPAETSAMEPIPGHVVGRVRMPDGRPIAAPNAVIGLYISGVSYLSGQSVSFAASVNHDGSFVQRVPEGSYRVNADVTVPYDGREFVFELNPVGEGSADRDSGAGIVQEFTWAIRGLRANAPPGSQDADDYYGHSVKFLVRSWDEAAQRHLPIGPGDARLVFTLTPNAPLIDSSAGSVMVHGTGYHSLCNSVRDWLLDAPLGVYSVLAWRSLRTEASVRFEYGTARRDATRAASTSASAGGSRWCGRRRLSSPAQSRGGDRVPSCG